ncbi:MAG: hypothetical protein LBE91_13235 [Tannerella sp.]|jgi:uncharacterized membrane protein YsdA (DUF1294 family)|nr:hypothetical protein [Tannerella sp.]
MIKENVKLQSGKSNNSRITVVSNSCIIIGACIILSALIYMIVNLDKADSIVTMWMVFMITGISLSFLGGFMGLFFKKYEKIFY